METDLRMLLWMVLTLVVLVCAGPEAISGEVAAAARERPVLRTNVAGKSA